MQLTCIHLSDFNPSQLCAVSSFLITKKITNAKYIKTYLLAQCYHPPCTLQGLQWTKKNSLKTGTTEQLHNIFKTKQNRLSIWWNDHTHNSLMDVDISKVDEENIRKDKIRTKSDLAQDDDHSINYALRTFESWCVYRPYIHFLRTTDINKIRT